jgi:hypothetical protein
MAAEITPDDPQYALDLVRRICSEVGPGLPGTPQERQRAAILKAEQPAAGHWQVGVCALPIAD